ncbi:MAG TPA: hypothetical protein VLH08_16020 [Acidobacteriota bacterium]|nr:hypothetical protein [Acidobacteriota bacterium]
MKALNASSLWISILVCILLHQTALSSNAQEMKTAPPKAGSAAQITKNQEREPNRSFQFESATPEVRQALKRIFELQRSVAVSSDDLVRKSSQLELSYDVVRNNSNESAAVLVENLRKLDPDDFASHSALLSILVLVNQEPVAIDFLRELALKGQPRTLPKITTKLRKQPNAHDRIIQRPSEDEDPQVLIRYMAMGILFSAARKGSQRATETILQTLSSPHREVKISSIQYYYALSKSRLRAKTQMRERLSPRDQYLLNFY